MERQQILKKFKDAIFNTVKSFYNNPFIFFYEEDLRVFITHKLIEESFEKVKFEIKKDFQNHLGKNPIYSLPIKAEYPPTSKKKKRFDIVYLENNGFDFYNLPVTVALELKLGSKIYDRCNKFKDDIKKLVESLSTKGDLNFCGIALYFYQNDDSLANINKDFGETTLFEEFVIAKEFNLTDNLVHVFIITPTRIYYSEKHTNAAP